MNSPASMWGPFAISFPTCSSDGADPTPRSIDFDGAGGSESSLRCRIRFNVIGWRLIAGRADDFTGVCRWTVNYAGERRRCVASSSSGFLYIHRAVPVLNAPII